MIIGDPWLLQPFCTVEIHLHNGSSGFLTSASIGFGGQEFWSIKSGRLEAVLPMDWNEWKEIVLFQALAKAAK